MPHSISVSPERRLAIVRFEGDFELEPAMTAPLELFAREDFEPSFGLIVDLQARGELPSLDEITAMAKNLVRFRGLFEGPVAYVVRQGPHVRLTEILAQMTSLGGISPQMVFTSVPEAEAWIESRIGDPPSD